MWRAKSAAVPARRELASERPLVQMLIGWAQQLAESPHLSELYYRGIHDFESLEGAERMRFSVLIVQLFRLYEETYYGQSDGESLTQSGTQSFAAGHIMP
jgi:hypothetical protein